MNTTFATILEIVGTLAFAISSRKTIRLVRSLCCRACNSHRGWNAPRCLVECNSFLDDKRQLPHRNGHSSYFRHYFQTILGKTRKYVFHIRYDRVSSICRCGSRKNTHVRISVLGSDRHGNHYGIGRQYHSRYPHQRRTSAIS